jgi:hypothetical protein
MPKYASPLALISLCLTACSANKAPAAIGQSGGPAQQAPASATEAAGSGSVANTPTQPPRSETGAPTTESPAAGSGGASAGVPTVPAGGDVTERAGSAAPVAGASGAADAGAGAPDGEPDPSSAGCAADPLSTLRGYAPSDEELAGDYEKYLTGELGTLLCATGGTGEARTITQTIYVPPNTTYDGKGETLTADAAAMNCDTSDGEQAESQQPIFLLAPGAQLKNVTIAYPGCEGVHMMGDNVLDHITWPDAGEDAASVRSYFPGGKITIMNSEGHKAADKMFQFNAPCEVRIENFTGSDMGKLVRQNGGTEFELHIDLNNVTVSQVISAVVQSDSPLCFVRHHKLSYMFNGSGDKSDRVFRDVLPENVTAY